MARTFLGIVIVESLALSFMILVWWWLQGLASSPFNNHPLLMGIAYIALETQAMVVFASGIFPHKMAKYIHAASHLLAAVCSFVGLYYVILFHNQNKIDNFYSLHSWLGLLVLCAFTLQLAYSLPVYLSERFSPKLKAALMPFHKAFGLLLYALEVAVICLGILEKQTFLQSGGVPRFGAAAMLINLAGVLSVALLMAVSMLLLLKHLPLASAASLPAATTQHAHVLSVNDDE